MKKNYLTIFLVCLFNIALELFLTRILNLKTWNHVVYTVIPFSMLGYGVGANIYLIFQKRISVFTEEKVLSLNLSLLAATSLISTFAIIYLPIQIEYIVNFFTNAHAVLMILTAYTIFMIPFIIVGFIVIYLFSVHPKENHKLYFFDLIGAGAGAFLFFPLINTMGVLPSLVFLSCTLLSVAVFLILPHHKQKISIGLILFALISLFIIPEPVNYKIDRAKGWEWIPGYFQEDQYSNIASRWHPLGRTDIYRIHNLAVRNKIYNSSVGTFEINLTPRPEFSYLATNFLAGTPIYHLSPKGLEEYDSKVQLFSQGMEVPYTILDEPKVVIIGTGGGRDIFMAKTHGAQKIVGAEINPAIYAEMSPGGKLYDYSGKIYTTPKSKIFNIDGRHLVKKLKPNHYDLIVLNGVDTFSGLSTGAYAYAESYLYTKDAITDYLSILNDDGIINLNRWFFPNPPRETLRLMAISLDALRDIEAKEPWNHIMIGLHKRWSLTLIKKTPFSLKEKKIIQDYFKNHETQLVFPTEIAANGSGAMNHFDLYAKAFEKETENNFAHLYPFDISVISDDNPFFYKYYKLDFRNLFNAFAHHHTGTVIFLTQALVLIQAIIFILLFIFLPLFIFRKLDIKKIPKDGLKPFVIFFGCLGTGFMMVEIPLMQKFVLLLGSPIYSISVTLTGLLIFSGIGSFLLPYLSKKIKRKDSFLMVTCFAMVSLILLFVVAGTPILNYFMKFSLFIRIGLIFAILFPIGICLGVFFPSGLQLISQNHKQAIAWAWGINSSFSVLGSILSIILAQFYGFNAILLLAGAIYLIAVLAFRRMSTAFH